MIRTQKTGSEYFIKYNNKDIIEKVEAVIRQLQDSSEYAEFAGVRFERRLLSVGDECGKSRSNADRDDTREFPEFGTPDYESLPELDGVCAYDVDCWKHHILDKGEWTELEIEVHLYVIEGDSIDYESGEDIDEVIIGNAEVMAVIY